MTGGTSSKLLVYAALAANLLIAVTKLVASWWTGSSAMLSEAVHSFVDTGNQALLLYGIHRSDAPPDENHPFGHGRELYFWSFIVALLMFTVGAGVTFYEGLRHIQALEDIADPVVNYLVLGASAIFEGSSWFYALRRFRKTEDGGGNLLKAARRSKDPPVFMVLFEDSAALIGLTIAFLGTFASSYFAMPLLDGVASIGISILLAAVALLLANESKGLLLGEPASPRTRKLIVEATRQISGVEQAGLLFTVHLSPDEIVAGLSIEFDNALTAPEIEDKMREIERAIRTAAPDVLAVFIKPQDIGTMRRAEQPAAA
jgi:cation diffusion facilitator family transporter